jgi:hypothetical protein
LKFHFLNRQDARTPASFDTHDIKERRKEEEGTDGKGNKAFWVKPDSAEGLRRPGFPASTQTDLAQATPQGSKIYPGKSGQIREQ